MPVLPDHMPVANDVDAAHPYRLVAAPARQFLNTSFTETDSSRRAESRPTLMLHDADAAELGVSDGDLVCIGNRLGRFLNVGQIRIATVTQGRGNTNQQSVGFGQFGKVTCRFEFTFGDTARNPLGGKMFDVALPALEQLDFASVDIEPHRA